MTVSIVIEIAAAIFIVFGVYSAARIAILHLAFSRRIREGVCLAVVSMPEDEPQDIELRLMYAERMSRELFACRRVILLGDDSTYKTDSAGKNG